MAGPTRHLLNAVTAPVATPEFAPQRVTEETGVVHLHFTGASFSIQVQGRSDPTAPWYTIDTQTQASAPALDPNGSKAIIVALFPEMRLDLTAITGTLSAWIVE
jgi:hypothetical protein